MHERLCILAITVLGRIIVGVGKGVTDAINHHGGHHEG